MHSYSEHCYDSHGQLKPPLWFWLCCLLLTRSCWLFVMAGASRQEGSAILTLFYPDQQNLYLAMASALPSIVVLLTSGGGAGHPLRAKVRLLTRELLWASTLGGVVLHLFTIYQQAWIFSWDSALILLGYLWVIVYLKKSRHLKDYAMDPPLDPYGH